MVILVYRMSHVFLACLQNLVFMRNIMSSPLIIIMNIQSDSYKNGSSMCKDCSLFFASQAFQGLCSSCYKKHKGTTKEDVEKPKQESLEVKVSEPIKKESIAEVQSVPKDKSRCSCCNRKVKNLGIECKCQLVFCNMHRLPEDHACTFDHMNAGKEKLGKDLIKLTAGKIDKME